MVFKRYTAETKAIHPRSLSDASWERVKQLEWTAERDAELQQEFARRYDRDATFLARWNQGWTRQQSRARRSQRTLGLDPAKQDRGDLLARALGREHVLRPRPLRRPGGVVRRVGRAACANDGVNWIVKLHPANVWKRRRDGVSGELDEHVGVREHVGELPPHVKLLDPDTDISTWSLFDVTDYGVTIRGSIGFELPVLRQARADRGHGLLLGPRLHRRLRDRASEYLGAARADPRARPAERRGCRAREAARVRALQAAPDAVHELPLRLQAGRGDRRPVRGDDRAEPRATRASSRGRRTYACSASGPPAPASSTTSTL